MQRQIEELKALTPYSRKRPRGCPRSPQQLPLIAAEDLGVSRITALRRPAPHQERTRRPSGKLDFFKAFLLECFTFIEPEAFQRVSNVQLLQETAYGMATGPIDP